jgi:hypothetical protein
VVAGVAGGGLGDIRSELLGDLSETGLALRIALLLRIVLGEIPSPESLTTQARMCSGRISTIRIDPNSGMRCLEIYHDEPGQDMNDWKTELAFKLAD